MKILGTALLTTVAVIVSLASAETVLRIWRPIRPIETASEGYEIQCGDCSYLYGLDPAHPEVSSQGLRDRFVDPQKPEGEYRILFLGDSVTFGTGTAPEAVFSRLLEDSLRRQRFDVSTINAGVRAYSPFNEVNYYLERGAELDPDLVVINFCMNDVIDPLPHWNPRVPVLVDIPNAAIPDLKYHDGVIEPRFRYESAKLRLLRFSALSQLLVDSITPKLEAAMDHRLRDHNHYEIHEGVQYPIFLTLEFAKNGKTLLDYESKEWKWLRGMYRKLAEAVHSRGSRLLVVVHPMAYHLSPGYPFLPQPLWRRFCDESSFECLDLLPALSKHRAERLYRLDRAPYYDVWHLIPNGHRVVAAELEAYLKSRPWFPKPAGG